MTDSYLTYGKVLDNLKRNLGPAPSKSDREVFLLIASLVVRCGAMEERVAEPEAIADGILPQRSPFHPSNGLVKPAPEGP